MIAVVFVMCVFFEEQMVTRILNSF